MDSAQEGDPCCPVSMKKNFEAWDDVILILTILVVWIILSVWWFRRMCAYYCRQRTSARPQVRDSYSQTASDDGAVMTNSDAEDASRKLFQNYITLV
ncbi:hypothetical protein MPTK1_5g22030 [Marchantia polymorpha subsp. ruderalis]|uniref:Uncharacterized protein n=2 Tax=Marchantia polymorpha TaxID=3197 RepID=A0AAF6BKZ5_MARPO|nr:hypothetical protein MARPO_0194s0006 [Marchantia polymorpha]PTQ27528.1 hypothetical protein MARPO_0194s0006 [Marchantia polymorpha]BBN12678.1 hypothetical protein Mp_5g22030 [Marchantia polymorpha subsp. ruderalis]BBN12679.1 hypothetical protein Mp_5g22030 [Marchantia polymorpha subsp. ruderalis]|eukprot:PTQ27527.1 hypothetical protein MARPO_0194s0006 [Marchantia polymorpha]